MSHPVLFQNLAGASFLSPTGQCKPFDALADGYCRGEAVGAVFLKKMSAAVADGDQILGVISSTAVQQNQNCTPIVVPNAPSLSDLFRKVVRRSGLEPSQVSVVEAHGTGTPVGDPAEYESVRRVFGGSSREKPLQLGSVKGLVGHTEGSSGVVSLAKILLMLQEGSIPPQASFSTINPAINATAADKMHIATSLQPWDAEFKAALINNYGASGSNASMLVTQAPRLGSGFQSPAGPKYPFWLCGLDDRSIRAYATRLRRFVKTKNPSIADLSFNVARQSNRSLERAHIFTASSIEELDNKLTALESGDASPVSLPAPRPLILCFGGQISTSVGLDRQVYDNVAVLRRHLDRCDATAQTLGVGSIYPHVFQKETIEDIVSLQTALFALQYATAKSWIDCGVEPAAVVGHSFGELTALCISGVLSLQDAMKAVIARATIIRDAWGPEKGSMLAVEADADEVNQLIAASNTPATIACFNGPTSHTIAGSVATIDAVVATITAKFPTLKFKRLNVSNAYHSTLVEALKPQLRTVGEGLTFNKPTIPVERATENRAGDVFSADFFAEHLRNPVYFSHAVSRLAKEHPNAIWLEAGSNATVTFMASKALGSSEPHHFQAVNVSGTQSLQKLIDTTTTLWRAGLRVAYWGHSRLQTYDYALLLLPPYQFDRQKHWLALKEPPKATAAAGVAQPALFTFVGYQDNEQRLARFRVNTSTPEYEAIVGGHKIAGTAPICPATVQIDLAIEALRSLQPQSSSALLPQVRDITNLVPVCVDPSRSVWLELEALDAGRLTWAWKMTSTSSSPTNAAPTTHVTGEIALSSISDEFARYEGQVSHARCMQLLQDDDPDEVIQGSRSIYRVFSEIVDYGERYHGLQKLVGKGHESAGRITKTHSGQSWLDAFLGDTFCQVGGIWVNCMTDRDPGDMYIANGIKRAAAGAQQEAAGRARPPVRPPAPPGQGARSRRWQRRHHPARAQRAWQPRRPARQLVRVHRRVRRLLRGRRRRVWRVEEARVVQDARHRARPGRAGLRARVVRPGHRRPGPAQDDVHRACGRKRAEAAEARRKAHPPGADAGPAGRPVRLRPAAGPLAGRGRAPAAGPLALRQPVGRRAQAQRLHRRGRRGARLRERDAVFLQRHPLVRRAFCPHVRARGRHRRSNACASAGMARRAEQRRGRHHWRSSDRPAVRQARLRGQAGRLRRRALRLRAPGPDQRPVRGHPHAVHHLQGAALGHARRGRRQQRPLRQPGAGLHAHPAPRVRRQAHRNARSRPLARRLDARLGRRHRLRLHRALCRPVLARQRSARLRVRRARRCCQRAALLQGPRSRADVVPQALGI
ncbi:Beta-ketoacyl synthase [Macrophomina phaseolina MS6]|uniref:Beta-ketoacyl synthase n=1 Tax=Macrophomina phaseolina (strain MS6) TaxID=1126212 RepID=K2RER4_MACPH|nr:Beta-ketoacyl synthase [Macrophomina phaseolina MS6]